MRQVFVAVVIGAALLIPVVVGALVLPLITGTEPDPAVDGLAARQARIAANARAVAAGDLSPVRLATAVRGYDRQAVDEVVAQLSDPGRTTIGEEDIGSIAVVRGGYRMDETDALIDALLAAAHSPRL